ncbi:MAG: P1 family peptidase [Anaerolineales bacterium]|nr:P1 family peptidase [Anaerolineales bacterium]MDW8161837.1 P1 family peptidase [Anaerolineales bacterium]
MDLQRITPTSIKGIRVGHAQDEEALTGCTVILCEQGAVGGVDQRGGAPGTRETDALHLAHLVEVVHAVVLAGGSAFGLDAASGVVRYLEERGVGFDTGVTKVPIVPAAILFDLNLGNPKIRPDAEMGYQACLNASTDPPAEGNVGAGMGATVGKILGIGQAMKGGIGCAGLHIGGGVLVTAIAAVNAFGDIVDPYSGEIIAGARSLQKGPIKIGSKDYFADTLEVMKSLVGRTALAFASRGHTVIGCVATNARLSKEQVTKVAQMAQDGVARAVRPAHTMLDGDTIFALATGEKKADVNIVGAFAAEVFAQAIVRGVRQATPIAGLPACSSTGRKDK